MTQEYILFNSKKIRQPDTGLGYNFETTYTSDTNRTQTGILRASAMFTVESFSYEASNLTVKEMTEILQVIAGGKKFIMRYFSPYYGIWRNDAFYVGKGSLSIGALNHDSEMYESLSFNVIGINPIDIAPVEEPDTDQIVNTQTKTATPTVTKQTIKADLGYDYLGEVIVLPIPYVTEKNAAGGTTVIIG